MELLFDENEIKSNEAMRFMAKGNQNKKISKYKKSNLLIFKEVQIQDSK